jgi:hypothetical protein
MRGKFFFYEKAGIVLSLASGLRQRRLKNFTVIPKDNELDSVLLIEFIPDFTRPGVFRRNQDQVTREYLMMTAVLYLAKTALRPQRSVIKFPSEISLPQTGLYRTVQRHKFHPYVICDSLYVTINTT